MSILDRFEIEDGILKAYTGPDADVIIPEGVHTIGECVFKGMSWILSVKLPSSLKTIGAGAFKGCRQLKGIEFPEGLTGIGEYAFHRCHMLEELIFPKSVTEVGNHAFLYCDNLKKVVLEGPKRLGKAVFSHNLMLNDITLNRDIDDINFNDEVFEGCVNLKRITLSGETYEIDNLIEAMDPRSGYPGVIRSIARSVYHTMQIDEGVLNKYSINLKSVFLPEGITAIGKGCFFDKKGIVKITLPGSVKEIKANAFLNCISLEEVTFLSDDVILDDRAFRGCCNLKRVHVQDMTYSLEDETPNELVSRVRDQVLGDFYISGKTLMRYMGNEEQIQIPKGIEIINERCFFGNERLKTVLCPDSLTEIREQAFKGCLTLQNIVLPEGFKRIEREAFAECKKLLKCNLPASLEYIGEYAFRRCLSLKSFDPWPTNANIHEYAFYLTGMFEKKPATGNRINSIPEYDDKESAPYACTGKKEIAPYACTGNENITSYAFTGKGGIRVLNLSGVKRIGKYAYASCPDLEEVVIDAPECVIERNAFSTCPKLKKVWIHVREIEKGCFSYCRELENVSISGVQVLPAECFAGCSMLSGFEAKEITGMGARCFDECIRLDSFDFTGIRVIGERAFERCDSLKNAVLGDVECGYHAFADCSQLESVEISDDTRLKSGAFTGCTQVRTVVYDSVKYVFSKFSDGLDHVGNPYPGPVREVISSIWSCFDIRERKVLAGYMQDAVAVTIPEDVEELGQDAFRDHIRLKSIAIPGSVRTFGSHAFTMTEWLDEQRSKSETVIVNNVLVDAAMCKGKAVIPSTVKRVAAWCFAGNTAVTELEIASERTGIEELAFRNCLNLKKITDWDGHEYVLNSVLDLKDRRYPDLIQRIFSECINCFKLDENGNLTESTGNITNLTFPEGIVAINDGVYKDCHLLESIDLSTDTARIGKSAFENSKWLKKVTNAGGVEYVGPQAFSGCQSLESIDLSDKLTELGSRCFEHCISLKEICLSDRLEKIPERAFFRCKSLKKAVVPKNVKVVEAEAFAFCDGLTEVYIPEGTQLADRVFAYCDHVQIYRY